MITVTLDKINGVDKTNDIRGIQSSDVVAGSLRPLTANTTSSAAIFKVKVPNASSPSGFEIQEWQVTETYAAILAALTQDAAESGAQLIANLVTSISGSSTDAQYPSAKLLYDQLALKEATANKNAASGYAGLGGSHELQMKNGLGTFTSVFSNSNTGARTYALPDTSGVVCVGSTGATVTFTNGVGVVTFPGAGVQEAAIKVDSRVILQEITNVNGSTALGVAYSVVNVAATSVTITMLDATGATETGDDSIRNCLVIF